ncbi:uncharacterized protein N7483_007918 [Penicillium malachiteum]|uniref:uncharacterized protein n=1 Tax=Penicillium malachiteum TaxID=1324776 RepID=UPI0025499613|nr:uncharacterized protein N7483_007918 [Penicillium malachiteum]KAJ5726561.1 hypothetical protein N7483_007918 [Penicillium malachiteum]
MSDPASYTVGWICALPVEYLAAQEFLDEEHAKPSFVSPNYTNDYALGRIGDHNVVIAVLPNGEYGTASAANVATNMLNSFHNIRIGLMVGIGGGVPSKSHDIRWGDIVVSAPSGDKSGVFQYDFGKSIQDMSFQHTRLFFANITRGSTSCDICADSPSKLVLRSERTDEDDNPAIHYAWLLLNKDWQGYAAMVAAAYAKDLLHQIAPNRIEAEERIGAVVFG